MSAMGSATADRRAVPSFAQKARRRGLPALLAATIQLASVALPGNPAHASDEGPTPYTLPLTETHTIYSRHVEDTFYISVALPLAYATAPPDREFPVVFAPDADIGFAMATQISRLMEIRQEVPAYIIVGIGYGGLQAGLARRARDLTPNNMQESALCANEEFPCGGAADFLEFIETELKPFVTERYRADTEDNAYFGYSLGGLFGFYVLFNEPGAFKRYAIGSPPVGWQNWELLQVEAAFATSHEDLPATLFLSVGGLEKSERVEQTVELAGQLAGRGYPGLVLTSHEFEGESHASGSAASFSRAMRVVFE